MVALKGAAIKGFLARRDENIAAVLIYGPDAGLVRERTNALARRIVEDFKDPFNYIELTDADIKEEPARITDEAAALSFAGGERVVRLKTTGEASAKSVGRFLDALDAGHVTPNGIVLIEAGDLSARSGLRKAFEKAKKAAALPCYADTGADIRTMAADAAKAEGLRFSPDALDLAVSLLGDDRGLSRAEIDKLILYKGPAGHRDNTPDADEITVEDVRASFVDSLGDAMNDIARACAAANPKALATALYRASAAGASPIGLLRALQRSFSRLQMARRFMEMGDSADAAMKKLRPPVFFGERRAFEQHLSIWSGAKLDQALRMLVDAELDAKKTGAPQREIIERTALRLAVMGGSRKRR